ncbi:MULTISPECIES: hypothetical protein [unclassified Kribbella]|uniref:hypothetical protein n=1 Tax=unclassified Kribbella TaxID=2644121 RepID=UPI0030171B34
MLPERESRPDGDRAASRSDGEKLKPTVTPRPIYGIKPNPALFLAALLQDLLNQGDVGHHLRRAAEWDQIDPFVALQLRRKAWVLAEYADDEISPEVWSVLAEVAA